MFKGRLRSLVLGSALLWTSALAAGAAETPPRIALILSEAAYPDADSPLKTSFADGKALAEALGARGFAVQTAVNTAGSAMAGAVQHFLDAIKPGSIAVVAFAGIGIQVAGKNYLIPVDARIWSDADVVRAGTSVDALVQSMADRGAKAEAVILDASRRNPFERRFRSVSAGLAAMKALPGTLSLASAAPGTLADGDETVFTTQLVKAVNTPDIDAEQAFLLCRDEVVTRTQSQQVPSVVSGLDVPFSFGAEEVAKPSPAVPPSVAHPPTAPASVASAPSLASTGKADAAPQQAPPPPPEPAPVVASAPAPAPVPAPSPVPTPPRPPAPAPAPAPVTGPAAAAAPSSVPGAAPTPAAAPPARVAALPPASATTTEPTTVETPLSPDEKRQRAELDRRIGRDPNDKEAVFERGRLLAQHGNYTLALLDFDRAISLNPNDADAFNDRCWTRSMADQLQTAMDDCDRALKLRPDFADAHDSRGLVLMKRGSAEAAVVDYDAAIRLDPKQSSALYGRGIAELRLGRREAAEKDISNALALDPGIEAEYARYGLK